MVKERLYQHAYGNIPPAPNTNINTISLKEDAKRDDSATRRILAKAKHNT